MIWTIGIQFCKIRQGEFLTWLHSYHCGGSSQHQDEYNRVEHNKMIAVGKQLAELLVYKQLNPPPNSPSSHNYYYYMELGLSVQQIPASSWADWLGKLHQRHRRWLWVDFSHLLAKKLFQHLHCKINWNFLQRLKKKKTELSPPMSIYIYIYVLTWSSYCDFHCFSIDLLPVSRFNPYNRSFLQIMK